MRPLLKWVGSKGQLLPAIRRFYPAIFGTYIEPFLGSGAVYFDLQRAGRLKDRDVVLIDSNADLIGCDESVRDHPEAVEDALTALAASHSREGSVHYYRIRDRHFNPQREARRAADGRIAYTPQLAAMLIYLNRTGFNGLFRPNALGRFNVPAGRYVRPSIVDSKRLRQVSAALSNRRVRLVYGSFHNADRIARARGLSVYRPAVRADQPHCELYGIHPPSLRRAAAAPAAAARRVAATGWLPCRRQQFDCGRDCGLVRHEPRGARCWTASDPCSGAQSREQQRSTARPVDEYLITNVSAS